MINSKVWIDYRLNSNLSTLNVVEQSINCVDLMIDIKVILLNKQLLEQNLLIIPCWYFNFIILMIIF